MTNDSGRRVWSGEVSLDMREAVADPPECLDDLLKLPFAGRPRLVIVVRGPGVKQHPKAVAEKSLRDREANAVSSAHAGHYRNARRRFRHLRTSTEPQRQPHPRARLPHRPGKTATRAAPGWLALRAGIGQVGPESRERRTSSS
jgi:hypothetical protein